MEHTATGGALLDTRLASIRHLEELALAAWPAFMAVHDGGYVLRLTDGYTKRANSVNALYADRSEGEAELAARIDRAEATYARHGLGCVFRLTPLAAPGLDAMLAARGYGHADETLVMLAPQSVGTPDTRVEVCPGVASDWVEAYAATSGLGPRQTAALARMMGLIAPAHATARVTSGGRIVGFGLGVLDRGHVGAYEILTAPEARRQGLARAIMSSLLDWGAQRGAAAAYLQVVASNAPATELYRALGYREHYRYHYRIQPKETPG